MSSAEGPNGTAYIGDANAPCLASYPHMRKCNGMLYVSGLSSRRPDGTHVGADLDEATGEWKLDVAAQTGAVIENMRSVLALAGADLSHVVDVTVFLVDMSEYGAMNAVYNTFFDARTGPSRTCVAVAALPHPRLRIEIKAIAVAPPAAE